MAILALAVAEITAIALAPPIASQLVARDALGFVVAVVVIVTIWNRRIPKVNLERAEVVAVEYVKKKDPELQGVRIDATRRGIRRGRKWDIFVNHLTATGVHVHTLDVTVDAGTGKAESDKGLY
jgi:hypothetical protein